MPEGSCGKKKRAKISRSCLACHGRSRAGFPPHDIAPGRLTFGYMPTNEFADGNYRLLQKARGTWGNLPKSKLLAEAG